MTNYYQPKDRVLVPRAGDGPKLPATVLLVFSNSLRPVLVHVDGDDASHCEAFALADVEPFRDTSTRSADSVAAAVHYPAECACCGRAPLQGSLYCSESCQRIVEGIPSPEEIAHDV